MVDEEMEFPHFNFLGCVSKTEFSTPMLWQLIKLHPIQILPVFN